MSNEPIRNMVSEKHFNTEGMCNPEEHYMVNLEERLKEIKKLVDAKKYFTINRARQYGKTTILKALTRYLVSDYNVISLDFQGLCEEDFESGDTFTSAFAQAILESGADLKTKNEFNIGDLLTKIAYNEKTRLSSLFIYLQKWCEVSEKPIVLIIDEVDNTANNKVFLNFLSQLRKYYLDRDVMATFHSVILAGVYDIKNLKMKIHPDGLSKKNSPWNIAADFDVTMSFSPSDIAGMLCEYEKDHDTGMDIREMSNLIYEYTSGYPFLVSRICKLIDEKLVNNKIVIGEELFLEQKSAWTKEGFLQAVKLLLDEKNTLFESLIHKITSYIEVKKFVYALLFSGKNISYNPDNEFMETIMMFGFAKNNNGLLLISNRIFETRLYNYFISQDFVSSEIYSLALQTKNQFISNGNLNIERILEKFVQHFIDIYGTMTDKFKEEEGRKFLLLYLKPIINGVGNYYIEAQTRDMRRTDIIIDYLGKQYIIELKIWHGEEYNKRGEQQLAEYLDYYHLETGYMLSFNFNKNKQIGMKHMLINGKNLIEAVV